MVKALAPVKLSSIPCKPMTIVRLAGIVVGSIPTPGIVFHAWSYLTSWEVDSVVNFLMQ